MIKSWRNLKAKNKKAVICDMMLAIIIILLFKCKYCHVDLNTWIFRNWICPFGWTHEQGNKFMPSYLL